MRTNGQSLTNERAAFKRAPFSGRWKRNANAVHTPARKRYAVQGCGCKSWYCSHCGFAKGQLIRKRLLQAVSTFVDQPLMVTLTIDPKQFSGPAFACEYVRENRCVSRFVRELKRRGYVASGKWFCVMEHHKNGWPHWHLLLDTKFIAADLLWKLWNRLGPGDDRWLGRTKVSERAKFDDWRHAAFYVTKYLTKRPEGGYPDWVLDSRTIFKRYTSSRGLLPEDKDGEEVSETSSGDGPADEYGRVAPTPRGRVAMCGSRSVVVEETAGWDEKGRPVLSTRYVFGLNMSREAVASVLNRIDENPQGALGVTIREVLFLRRIAEGRERGPGG